MVIGCVGSSGNDQAIGHSVFWRFHPGSGITVMQQGANEEKRVRALY